MSEKTQLEAGDVLYGSTTYVRSINAKYVIDRVTKNFAMTKSGVKFRRGVDECGYASLVDSGHGAFGAHLETPELKRKFDMYNIRVWFRGINFEIFSDDQLIKIKAYIDDVSKGE